MSDFSGLQLQPLEVNDFSGGMTDFWLQGDSKRFERGDNFVITVDKQLEVRPGSIGFDYLNSNHKLSRQARINSFMLFKRESELLAVQGRSVYYLNSTPAWTELTGPSGGLALSDCDVYDAVSWSEWKDHLYLTSEARARPSKIYRDSSNAMQVRTVGLPLPNYNPAYTNATLLARAITLANDIRHCMLDHMRDYSNTNPLSGVVSGYLHGGFDKYSAQYMEQQTWTGSEAESNSAYTPAPDATDTTTLYTLVVALAKAYNHHGIDPVGNLYHFIPFYDKVTNSTAFTNATKGPFSAVPTTTPTSLDEAASRLDTIRTRWYWHQFGCYLHDDHNTYSILNRHRLSAPKVGTVDQEGVPAVTSNYDDFIRYVNYLKNAFNYHVTDSRQGADWLSTFGPTSSVRGFHVNPNGQAYPFGTYGASTPGVLYDIYPHWVTLPDATDWDSATLLITWITLMYGLIHYNDANIAAHTNFTASQTSGSASYTSVAAVGGGAITLPSNAWIQHSSLGFTASGDVGYDGNSFDNFTGARVTASGSGTATLSKKANFTLNPVTLGYSTSFFHGSFNATQLALTTTTVAITTAAEKLDASFLNRFAILTSDLPTTTAEWISAAATTFAALAAHIANPLPHYTTYDITGNYQSVYNAALVGANLLSGNGAFFVPEVEEVSYAVTYKHTYTLDSGVEYEVISEPVYTGVIETGKIYPIGTSLASGITGVNNGAVTVVPPVYVTNLPVLTNDAQTNYATSEVLVQVYRTVDSGNTYYLCTEIANGTTTFTDYISDSLNSAGVDSLDSRDTLYTTGGVVANTQPPRCKYVHVLGDTAYYGYIEDSGQILKNRIIQAIPGTLDGSPLDFSVDVADELTGLSSARSKVIAFCYKKLYRLEGQFDERGQGEIIPESISDEMGCVSGASIVQTEIGTFFAGNDGFYYTDAYQLIKVSLELDLTYKIYTKTRAQQERIHGTYDRLNRRVYWTVQAEPFGNDCSEIFVFHLDYGVKPSGGFTTWSNGDDFRPSAITFFQGDMIRGDARGLIFRHNELYLTDPKVPTDVTTTYTDWGSVHIPWDYTSCAFDFGSIDVAQYVTKLKFLGYNVGNFNLQVWGVTNNKVSTDEGQRPLAPMRYDENIMWGDPMIDWGDDITWKVDGEADFWRRFPGAWTRSRVKQVRFLPAWLSIYKSDDYPEGCTASVSSDQVSLNLPSDTVTYTVGFIWPLDVVGMSIAFENDNYVNEYEITAILGGGGGVITVDDPDSTLGNMTAKKWVIRGYMKEAKISPMAYVIKHAPVGERGKAFDSDTDREKMPNPSLDLKNITDLYVRNNFDQINTFYKNQQQMLDFRFLDVTFDGAESRRLFHGLGRIPVDLIRLSMVGSGVVTFDRSSFDNDYLVVTSTAACRVRFYAGSYAGDIGRSNFSSAQTEQWFSNAPADVVSGVSSGIPPAGMLFWPDSNLPNPAVWGTWLWVDGSKKLIASYAALYAQIKTRYNTGGESNAEFRLPAPMGRVPLIAGSGTSLTTRTLAATGGEETHVLTTPELASHNHIQDPHRHTMTVGFTGGSLGGGDVNKDNNTNLFTYNTAIALQTATNQNTGSGTAHNVMNPYFVLNFIIKA